jgi:phosphoribosylaminoimidazole-succinocarboxamide synthase
MVDLDLLARHVEFVLDDATIPELPNHYRGKVRDNYDLPDGRRIIIATDRLSAFDRAIAAIPFKGQVLTQIARFWFDRTADLCPNHVIEYPDPNVLVCRRLDILPVEVVVRDYLAGTTATSVWSMYKAGRREIYGLRFPDGLRENEKLPETVITPTTKARDGEHDEPVTAGEIVGGGLLTPAQWQDVSDKALALFARGRDIAAERGLILVDTKYEMGLAPDGALLVIDEIHTPDSSRYWYADDYEKRLAAGQEPRSLDKEFVRRWLAEERGYRGEGDPPAIPDEVRVEAAARYIEIYQLVTGRRFEPDRSPDPAARVAKNLGVAA